MCRPVIHCVVKILLCAAVLYGGLMAEASRAQGQQATPLGVDAPHIALLLPVDSSVYRRHAEAVRDGFLAASQLEGQRTMLIRVYPVSEDPKVALNTYLQALQTGARLVVGPLIRAAVSAIATSGSIPVPTLVLNVPEGNVAVPQNLYVLSLQIETEARQIARTAWRDGRRSAYCVIGAGPLHQRMQRAFSDEFTHLGGKIIADFQFSADPGELRRFKQAADLRVADMVFLALDMREARVVRAWFEPLPPYATSTVYSGTTGPTSAIELAGIRFVDMPWLLQRDHPAVAIYPRPDYRGNAELERMYALGIDAWRIGQALLARQTDLTFDGVTGKLTLGRDGHFARELVNALISGPEQQPVGPIGPPMSPPPPSPSSPPAKP